MSKQDVFSSPSMPFDHKWSGRQWTAKRLQAAPSLVSVDLHHEDGAPAEQGQFGTKLRRVSHLLDLGFKQIGIGEPAVSTFDFDFCRYVIERRLVPDDACIQVMTECREASVIRTLKALAGAKNVVLHMYDSAGESHRRARVDTPHQGLKGLAVEGARLVKDLADEHLVRCGSTVTYEYSPGSCVGICHMIRRHAANEPLDDKVLSSADAFFKDCHARLLHFVVVHVSGKRLTGRVALNWSWGRVAQKEKAGEPIEMNDLKMLRQYQAFLTPKQSEQLDKWMSQCINAAINSFKRLDNGETSSASASSSAAVVTVEPTNDSMRDTTRDAVMNFFATKN